MVLCVVGHMPREINRYIWFAIEEGANITAPIILTNTKRFPLAQGGLEIEIKATVIWENKKNLKIFAEKANSLQFTLGEPYQNDTKNFLHKIKRKENDVCESVSSDKEPEDLYLRTKNQKIKLNFVLLHCVLDKFFLKL